MEPLPCASGEYIALKYHVMPKMSQIRLKSDKVLKTVNFERLLRIDILRLMRSLCSFSKAEVILI